MTNTTEDRTIKQLLDMVASDYSRNSILLLDFKTKQVLYASPEHILFGDDSVQSIEKRVFDKLLGMFQPQGVPTFAQRVQHVRRIYYNLPIEERHRSVIELSLQMKDRHGISNWISVLLRPISFTNDGRTEIAITTASYSLSPFHHLAYIRNLENRTEYILGDKGTWEKIYYEPLDSRELSTLRLTAQGYVNKEISTQVGLTESYVKKIKKSAYAKLHAANINEAISAAFRMHVRYF